MKPNPLPPDILKLLPPPGDDHLSPDILNQLSSSELLDCLSLVPREKIAVMVETVVGWSDQIAAKMTTEAWQRRLRDSIRAAVLSGTLPTLRLITAAEHCRAIDLALREILAEGIKVPGDIAATALDNYQRRALLRDITTNSAGHPEDNFSRDIGITILMTLVMVRWPYLRKSVSRASKKPSASKIVAAALNRRGVTNVTHGTILKIFNSYDLIADRLAGLIAA